MNEDGLIFVCVILAGILLIGVTWQAMNAWLDHRDRVDHQRRAAARARRFDRLSDRRDSDGPLR